MGVIVGVSVSVGVGERVAVGVSVGVGVVVGDGVTVAVYVDVGGGDVNVAVGDGGVGWAHPANIATRMINAADFFIVTLLDYSQYFVQCRLSFLDLQ